MSTKNSELKDLESRDLQIGKAGEYIACADLIMKGFVAYPSEQGLPYDIVLDIGDRLLKVQVKTTETYRTVPARKSTFKAYIFCIRRRGKRHKKFYTDKEVESKILNINLSTVYKYFKKNYKPFETKATYFSDLTRSKDWFYEQF